ncbi:hypothetical protein EC604_02445 [Paenibacillus amylolyticus]|uniref:Uncharacterized protein n=1 Tax=Paenibacillus amylolyticus TaxID=1451 RepID=A0A5M9WMB0_PAEAM|nr:hypothetical protein [Paenibacillus amylolyticus]KAA8782705.1 hypothetical protein EC604_02445 [Paenibacillus amylolyticus]
MRNLKEGIRKQFYTELGKFIAPEGYVEHREADSSPTDYTFKKNVKPGVVWSLHSHLGHSKPPYAVYTIMACRYEAATERLRTFLEKHQITLISNAPVGFGNSVERYTQQKHSVLVSSENIQEAAQQTADRFKEAESKYLLPRIDQGVAVDEYLTKRPHHWPTGDLFNCCVTILSYGLLTNDRALVQKGIERTFEILNKPGYSQRNRDFFEALQKAVEHEFI